MPHFMQFSVPANKSCTLACVLVDCNGTKWTGNARASQQQLAHNSCWGETNFPQVAISFLLVFSGHDMNEFDRFDCRLCCDSRAGIFKWIFDHFLSGYRTCFTIHVLPYTLTCGFHVWLTGTILVYRWWILHRFQYDFLKMSQFTVISSTICFIWNPTFHAVLCSCMWIHVTLCANGLHWHKMNRKCPDQSSSCFLTTAAERNKLPKVAISLLVWSFHPMIWSCLWQIRL